MLHLSFRRWQGHRAAGVWITRLALDAGRVMRWRTVARTARNGYIDARPRVRRTVARRRSAAARADRRAARSGAREKPEKPEVRPAASDLKPLVKALCTCTRHSVQRFKWWRGEDLNLRPSGYETYFIRLWGFGEFAALLPIRRSSRTNRTFTHSCRQDASDRLNRFRGIFVRSHRASGPFWVLFQDLRCGLPRRPSDSGGARSISGSPRNHQ